MSITPRCNRKRNILLSLTICGLLFGVCTTAQTQQHRKFFRIGYFSVYDAATEAGRVEGIQLALRELGYIEGQNLGVEYRYAEQKRERYPEFAAEFVRRKFDVIVVAGGFLPIQALKNATNTTPVIMAG